MLLGWKGLQTGSFLLLMSLAVLYHRSDLAPWTAGLFEQLGLGKGCSFWSAKIAPWQEHVTPGGLSYPLLGVRTLMLLVVLRALKNRKSLPKYLNLALAATVSPSATTLGVRGETMFDCTNAKNTVADVDLSVVSECPNFKSTYQNASLLEVQIIQRTASTLIETNTCNLILSREACHCK